MKENEFIKQEREKREKFTLELIEKYKSGKAHLSYSSFKTFLESPYSFISYKMGDKKFSDEMDFGKAYHLAVFKRDEYEKTFITDEDIVNEIGGGKPRSTNVYKAWKLEKKAQGKQIIASDDYKKILLMSDALWRNEASLSLLKQVNEFEKSSSFEFNGFKFILYHDAIGDIHLDLKTCQSANQKKFAYDVFKFGYNMQASIYTLDNLTKTGEALPYWNIAQENNSSIACFEYSESLINFGIKKLERGLKDFQRCLDENLFHKSFDFYAPNEKGYYLIDLPPYLS